MDKYRIRRAILDAVEAQEPGLTTMEELAQYPVIRMLAVDGQEMLREVNGLVEHEYLSNARPGREPLLRLTAKGRDQIRQETDLDEYVWGELASRFQR